MGKGEGWLGEEEGTVKFLILSKSLKLLCPDPSSVRAERYIPL